MVAGLNWLVCAHVAAQSLLAQEAAKPVLQQLERPQRTAVIMVLMGIALTGVILTVFVMLGAHWVRRQARREFRKLRVGDVESRTWRDALRSVLPAENSGETTVINTSTDETRAD